MAGAPRRPTNILQLKGTFKKDPARGRARENEPVAVGELGEAPSWLTEKEKRCWNELRDCCHKGVLCEVDRQIVEHGARLLAELRSLVRYNDTALMIRYEAVLSKLGMTPVDRSRVQVLKPTKDSNPFSEF